jgi:beta-hydroxyacyl-ACP dehydratase FabZ
VKDIQDILEVMPHRYPILLIDRVLEIGEKSIRAVKNVTFNEPHFQGHFPGHPVMPGVLLVEAMAQAGGYLLLSRIEDRNKKLIYFTGIDNCRFRRPVVPGDQVIFDIEVKSIKRTFAKIHGTATVDGEVACEADMMSAMMEQ